MTVAVFHVGPEKVTLVTDTLSTWRGRVDGFRSKVELFPHVSMMLVCRGYGGLLDRIADELNATFLRAGIDDAAPIAEELVRDRGRMHALWGEKPFQLWLFGYSPGRQRFVGHEVRTDADDGRGAELPTGWYCHPFDLATGPCAAELDPGEDGLVEVAKIMAGALNRDAAADGDDPCAGGDLVLYRLDRSGFKIRKAYRFEHYGELAARMGAP